MKTIPIELIKKAELKTWVQDDRFAANFPTWIVSLIKAEASGLLQECDFPTDDDAFRHGYDGTIIANGSALNIPKGKSVWELGKDEDVRTKAKYEYNRVLKQLGDDAVNHTFVFVSPRPFPQKKTKTATGRFNEKTRQDWVNTRNNEGEFKEVRVIDEGMLRDWSERHLGIGLKIKKIFEPNFSDQNIELPKDTVKRYVAGFSHDKIDENILFCGREELVATLQTFQTEGDTLKLFASSEDEAMAFASAALLTAESNSSTWAPALVIKDPSTLKAFHGHVGKTFIVTSLASSEAYGVQSDNNVIVCCAVDAKSIDKTNVLRDPQFDILKKTLEEKEIEDAGQLAGMAGGSINCLRRLLGDDSVKPPYMTAEADALDCIIFATLLGGWNESDKNNFEGTLKSLDKHLIESNLPEGISFSQFKRYLNTHIDKGEERTAADVLLKRIGKSYLIKAPVDAIDNVIGSMEPEHFERYEKILIKVFSGENETPKDPNSPLSSGHYYSSELQTGLALNFCILAYRGVERKKDFCEMPASHWIAGVFKKLTKEVDFIEFIQNKAGLLGYFAEASPDAFMDALEECLQGNEDGIKWLLTLGKDDFNIRDYNHATGLMWALQNLAWNPNYFERVLQAIIELNQLDPAPNANMHPRPSSLFREFFVTFSPQTSVDWKERIRILRAFPAGKNKTLFPLIASALPQSHDSISSNSRPIFGRFQQPIISNKDYYDVNESMFNCALERTDGVVDRICLLVNSFSEMNNDVFAKAVSQLKSESLQLDSEAKLLLWKRLRGLIVRHSRFPDADWTMSVDRLSCLSEWRDEIKPSKDGRAKYLFSEAYIQDFDVDDGITDNKLDSERINAVTEMLETRGLEIFLDFAGTVNEQSYLGLATAKASKTLERQINLVRKAVMREDVSELFLRGCSQSAYDEYGEEWLNFLLSDEVINGFPEFTVKMLACLRIDNTISNRLNSNELPKELLEKYWNSVYIDFWPREEVKLKDIEQLLKHERQAEVLSALNFYLEKQNDDVLKALTVGIYNSVNQLPLEKVHGGIIRDILHLLKLCKQRNLFPIEELAKYEIPLAKHIRWNDQKYPLAIHELATNKAEVLIELLASSYKTLKPHPAQKKTHSEEDKKHQWEIGYHILQSMQHPRLAKGKTPKPMELENWISAVRTAAKEYGLEEVADYKIGEILGMSSPDAIDGIWPRSEVREIIEVLSSPRMLNGIQTKQFNERGVYSDGYNHFNKLADKFEEDAENLTKWPKTQKFLKGIAKSDRSMADADKKRNDQYKAMPKL